MKRLKHYTLFAFCFSVYIGCAKVQFSDVPAEGGGPGVTPGGIQTGTKDGGKKAVDILFVVDNSASMSTEQASMASRFNNFIGTLNAAGLDYRIGITTTDISNPTTNPPRSINQNGALQDGKLIAFGNGSYYLTPSTANITSQFNAAIQRQETATCEAFLASSTPNTPSNYLANCPSGDERGIYAANLFLMNNSASMVRPEAHLAIIFLADEDERSHLYDSSSTNAYPLETLDKPATLITNMQALGAGKSYSAHSIIVKPGDSACLSVQNGQTHNVNGSYGDQYAQVTASTGGTLGDVCAADYTSQLNNIGYSITAHVNEIELGCPNPQVISVDFNPVPGAPTWSLQGSKIVFSSTLPVNMVVNYSWKCNPVQ